MKATNKKVVQELSLPAPRLLLHGIDTVQCSYYLKPTDKPAIDFLDLQVQKEKLRAARFQEPAPLCLGSDEFLLSPHGTSSGYPFLIRNQEYAIAFGEFNDPSFHVTYSSQALWHETADTLHRRFLDWAASVGYAPFKPETLSRVDLCFDYHLPCIDFDEDAFVSLSNKDSQHREDGKVQTFTFGKAKIVLRVYDKVAEIRQQSGKTWFFDLWGQAEDVWRIEWQVRKELLRRFDILTFTELQDRAGDLLRYLASEHDTLRVPTSDTNRSRWPLHPLWLDLQQQILHFNAQGLYRSFNQADTIEQRLTRLAISQYGNLKQLAALHCMKTGREHMSVKEALFELSIRVYEMHQNFQWKMDVGKRIKLMRLGYNE